MHFSRLSMTALAAVTFTTSCLAHSWIEEMRIIGPDGIFTDATGYPRGNAKRGPGVDPDKAMVHRLPPDGTPVDVGLQSKDVMCMPSQQKQVQTDGSPRLKAAAGDFVALRYQENGHVTLPQTQLGKAPNRGTVYIYGTTEPSPEEKFLDVHKKWTADGSGGNKKGRLLATQNYDDGRCYQKNGGEISTTRQKQFPHEADPKMGGDLWCQNDIAIPKDAPSGKPYTLYWVWDWPTAPNVDPGLPKGKAELYTTCMDVDIVASQGSGAQNKVAVKVAQGQSLNNAAIPSYVAQLSAGGSAPVNPAAAPSLAAKSASASTPAAQSAPVSAPAASSAPVSAATPAAAQSAPAQNPAAQMQTLVLTITTVVPASQPTPVANPQSTSTTLVTMARSTQQVTAAGESAIPTVSLPNFSGVATPVSAASQSAGSGYRMFRRVNIARPSQGN